MSFNGPGPEIINGRLAMLAFAAAMSTELFTGVSVYDQFKLATIPIVGLFFTIWVASLVPLYKGSDTTKIGSFNFKTELINGRAAMLGFALMLIIEGVKHTNLFS